jgi:hypothetical protein
MLADRLKMSLSEVMKLSTLEIDMWLAYIKLENEANNKAMKKARQQSKIRKR